MTPPGFGPKWVKLKRAQGYRDPDGNVWRLDRLHKDHWDVSDLKGKKISRSPIRRNAALATRSQEQRQKSMSKNHPYKQFEKEQVWRVLDRGIRDLVKNGDLEEKTAR